MKDKIYESQYIEEFISIIDQMYQLGWNERNAGNVSMLLDDKEALTYFKETKPVEVIYNSIDAIELAGRYVVITGTGKYFRNVKKYPEKNLGVIRVHEDGKGYDIMWGFLDGSKPTSEFSTHLYAHIEKLKHNKNHKIVIHTHATYLNALTMVTKLDEKLISRLLWKVNTENIIIFPQGVGIVPWEIPGNSIIGKNTADKLAKFNIVLWPLHGVIACGETLDEAFGIIETAEKAAKVIVETSHAKVLNQISDKDLYDLSKAFNTKPNLDFLELD